MSTTVIKKLVTIHRELNDQIEARTGPRGYSAYVNRALENQLALDKMREYLDDAEVRLGPIPDEVMKQVYEDLAAANADVGGQS